MNAASWDAEWSKKYERYNRHHQFIWNASFAGLKGNVVDLGCGPCVMYEGKEVGLVGIDWSAEALKQARLHYPYGIYIQADATATGLPPGQFDAVGMFGLLDYFEDWEPVLKEARRLVKPDGKIIATLLDGFRGHNWKNYPRICGNWHLLCVQ